MKRVLLLLTLFASMAFGYNYSGTWKNASTTGYNDPVVLKISGNNVSPILKRGEKRVTLKSKEATNVGNGLFEAWGHGYKNLVLLIKPINNNKLRVYAKKIDTKKKRVITKTFIFKKKSAPVNIRKRFVGNYISSSRFSAIKKLAIREVDGKLYVRAWRNTRNGLKTLGVSRAKLYNNRLHLTWSRGNFTVEGTIKGYNYSSKKSRYKNLELYVKATNLNSGLTNTQTIQFKRGNIRVPKQPQPIHRRVKIGPVDVNFRINSY